MRCSNCNGYVLQSLISNYCRVFLDIGPSAYDITGLSVKGISWISNCLIHVSTFETFSMKKKKQKSNNWIKSLRTLAGKVTARESTLGSRPLPCRQFETPAPGDYDVDRVDKPNKAKSGCIRGYTFGHPNARMRTSRSPGNKYIGEWCIWIDTHRFRNRKTQKKMFDSMKNFS